METTFRARLVFLAIVSGIICTVMPALGEVVVTYDLRVAGMGAKLVELTSSSQVVDLDVYAMVSNHDSDHSNDGVVITSLRFLSVETTALSLQGNYQNAIKAPGFDGPFGVLGSAANLDTNPDLEWGSINPNLAEGNFNPADAELGVPVFGTGKGSGPTEIKLGSIQWAGPLDVGSNLNFSATLLNVAYLKNPITRGGFTILSDGVAYSGGSVLPANADLWEAVGTPVVIVPEPASTGVACVLAIQLLLGRQSRSR